MKHLITASLLPILLLGCAVADPTTVDQPAAVIAVQAPDFDEAAMDVLLSAAVERGEIIGVSALVYDEGQIVYENAFGLRDRERAKPATTDTVWRIYSMTKPVTSALIMDLVEDGFIALDDPAANYIPAIGKMKVIRRGDDGTVDYVEQSRPITIEDLLLHRSGMAYGIFGGSPVEEAYAAADLFNPSEALGPKMERLADLPLVFQPGEAWYYSYSIDVLARIAEVVTDKPFAELLHERFFEPLGMSETGFHVKPAQQDRFASNYAQGPRGGFALAEDAVGSPFADLDNAFASGGGGLVSTQADYARFAAMMLNGGVLEGRRYLEEETVRMMMTDHLGDDPQTFQPWIGGETGAGFGYGGSVQIKATSQQQRESGRYPGQWGWGGAARTNMFIDPENNSFGIIMLQFFSRDDPQIHADFQALVLEETRNAPLGD